VCLAVPTPAQAATIGVTRNDDPPVGDPSGCSLRQAVQAANLNTAVGACPAGELGVLDTIQLPLSVALTAVGADDANQTGDLDVLAGGPLRIEGTGAGSSTIAQTAANERVLNLVAGSLELRRVVVTGGNVGGMMLSPDSDGGGILARASTKLTLIDSTVSGNTARQSGGIANGTRISADRGGDVLIVNSTVSGNTATAASGGGMGAAGIGNVNGTLSLVNSTVSGNVTGGRGGGIYNEAIQTISSVNLVSSTISDNAGAGGANLHNSGNGGAALFRLRGTIVSDFRNGSNCGASGNGSFTSLGYNLADDGGCALTESTDRPETDPLLGPLAANGGPTLTHALLAGSPAIDHGTSDLALTGVDVLTTDQRGLTRPVDFTEIANAPAADGADIGAFELQRPPPTPVPPVVVDDSVTIRIGGNRLRIDRRGVARIRLSCPRAEQSSPCRGTLTLRTRGRVRFRGKRRQVVLARASFRIDAGKTATVRLRLAASKAGLVRRSLKAVAIASVKDAAGNGATVRQPLQVLPPARRR
jgi:hypothetical protein